MSPEVPVSLYRAYVRIPYDQPFSCDNWCNHLAVGGSQIVILDFFPRPVVLAYVMPVRL